MQLKDLRVAWRVLLKEPSYSLIVVLGLSLAMCICFLLLGLVRHQYSYDDEVPDAENIYYVNEYWRSLGDSGKTGGVSLPAMQSALDSGLGIEGTMIRTRRADIRISEQLYPAKISLVSKDFASIFSVKALSGDIAAATSRPDTLAITDKLAKRLFGDLDPIGRTISINAASYTIRAVFPSPPANSSLDLEAIAGFNSQFLSEQERSYLLKGWGTWIGQVYFKTSNPANAKQIVDVMDTAFKKSSYYANTIAKEPNDGKPHGVEFRIGKLRDRNLDPNVSESPLQSPGVLASVSSVGVIILLLAMANYLNLTTVRVIQRQREIALRKILGASAPRLLIQFICESSVVCFVAFMLAMILAWLLLPSFSSMLALEFPRMFDFKAMLSAACITLLLSILCALYPAWIALKVRPTSVLVGRGNEDTSSGSRLRRILSVLQFSTAMALTAIGAAYAWQNHFLSQLNPGFNAQGLITMQVPLGGNHEAGRAFQQELQRLPGIQGVASSWSPLREIDGLDGALRAGQSEAVTLYRMGVNLDFFQTYGLQAIAGRVFSTQFETTETSTHLVLNQSAARKLGFADPQAAIGTSVRVYGKEMQIIGVVADVKQIDPRKEAQASMFFLENSGDVLALRVQGDKRELQSRIESIWHRYFPDVSANISSIEADYAKTRQAETTVGKFINLSSVVSILIAAFGIYALAAYSVQRRAREIILRKIHGAPNSAIARLVFKEFFVLVSIAALLGLPIAHLKIQTYLAMFQDVAPIGVWTLFIALALGNLVALGSTTRHTIKAMKLLPTEALRTN